MYLVIPEDADGLDDTSGHLVERRDRAVELYDALVKDCAESGDPVAYRLFRLVDVDESEMWDWGVDLGTGREPLVYVCERAARNCTRSGDRTVRRRLGTTQWVDAALPVAAVVEPSTQEVG